MGRASASYLLTCLLAYLLNFLPSFLPYLLTYLFTCLLTYLLTCLLTYLGWMGRASSSQDTTATRQSPLMRSSGSATMLSLAGVAHPSASMPTAPCCCRTLPASTGAMAISRTYRLPLLLTAYCLPLPTDHVSQVRLTAYRLLTTFHRYAYCLPLTDHVSQVRLLLTAY